jgi:hypothetical protein
MIFYIDEQIQCRSFIYQPKGGFPWPKGIEIFNIQQKTSGSHCRRYSNSTEDKLLKIVKSYSSGDNPKLETHYSPKKGSPKVN